MARARAWGTSCSGFVAALGLGCQTEFGEVPKPIQRIAKLKGRKIPVAQGSNARYVSRRILKRRGDGLHLADPALRANQQHLADALLARGLPPRSIKVSKATLETEVLP